LNIQKTPIRWVLFRKGEGSRKKIDPRPCWGKEGKEFLRLPGGNDFNKSVNYGKKKDTIKQRKNTSRRCAIVGDGGRRGRLKAASSKKKQVKKHNHGVGNRQGEPTLPNGRRDQPKNTTGD